MAEMRDNHLYSKSSIDNIEMHLKRQLPDVLFGAFKEAIQTVGSDKVTYIYPTF